MMRFRLRHVMACAVLVSVSAGLVAATSATLELEQREFTDREYGWLPAPGSEVTVNPPPISWMRDTRGTSWALEIARDRSFNNPEVRVDDWPWLLYTHTEPLGEGEYFWRYRFSDKDGQLSHWSEPLSFIVPKGTPEFPRPSAEELRKRIPSEHPRMYTTPEKVKTLREEAKEGSEELENLLKTAKAYLKTKPMEEPKPWTGGKWNVEEWRAYMREAGQAASRMSTMAFAWMLTGEEQYGEGAKAFLLEFSGWDPLGPSGMKINDEVGMPVLFSMSRSYDWLYDYLSEEERETVREALRDRANATFDHMRVRPYEQMPFNSHFGRMWHWLGEAGVSLYGEVPEAEVWLDHAMMVFYSWYPFWGDSDGGWAEGIWYWSSYNSRVTTWLLLMDETMGLDGAKKPFYSNVADFPLFVAPPGNPVGGFGDFAERSAPGSAVAKTALLFAQLRGNPTWQWYAETQGAKWGNDPLDYLRRRRPSPEAKAPTDLPLVKVFQKSGIAAFNTDVADAENNLHLALRCSEFGNISHSHSDQNAIVLAAFGEPLLVNTGLRDFYNSPFVKNYYWHTRSHNAVLIDGKGQPRDKSAAGSIVAYGEEPDHLAWAVGDASNAYGDFVKVYRRWVAFLPDRGAVLVDEVETTGSEISLRFHARAEFDVTEEEAGPVFRVNKGRATLRGTVLAADASTSQTDKYPLPLHKGIERRYDEWHLRVDVPLTTGSIAEQAGDRKYIVTFLEVGKDKAPVGGDYQLEEKDGRLLISKTEHGRKVIDLEINRSEPAVVRRDEGRL